MSESLSAGEFLERLIEKRGLNPRRLASLTRPTVSDGTIRSYIKGGPTTPAKLLAIARAFGPSDGPALLRAFDLHEMADHLEADFQDRIRRTLSHAGADLTRVEEDDALAVIEAKLAELAEEVARLRERRRG